MNYHEHEHAYPYLHSHTDILMPTRTPTQDVADLLCPHCCITSQWIIGSGTYMPTITPPPAHPLDTFLVLYALTYV
eukprot:1140736-Pelagomonas_calceolata.AAC.5